MSHNLTLINSEAATRTSDYNTNLLLPRLNIGRGEANDYDQSNATTLSNSTLYFYDSSPENLIPGATITGQNNWYSSVTLPAGRYFISACFVVRFNASGQFAYQIFDGSSQIGNRAQIGDTLQFALESCVGTAYANIESTSSMTISVKSASSNSNLYSIADQNDIPSKSSYLTVLKIS